MVNDFHLEQLVHESTRDNHTLDLILCTDPARVMSVSVILIMIYDFYDL